MKTERRLRKRSDVGQTHRERTMGSSPGDGGSMCRLAAGLRAELRVGPGFRAPVRRPSSSAPTGGLAVCCWLSVGEGREASEAQSGGSGLYSAMLSGVTGVSTLGYR